MTNRMLTPTEVCELLSVTPETLRMWRKRRQGPSYVKLGHRTVRYWKHDVEAWVATKGIRHE